MQDVQVLVAQDLRKALGDTARELRKARGKQAWEVAAEVGVEKSTIYALEQGHRLNGKALLWYVLAGINRDAIMRRYDYIAAAQMQAEQPPMDPPTDAEIEDMAREAEAHD